VLYNSLLIGYFCPCMMNVITEFGIVMENSKMKIIMEL
jgi:hypothetical protein